MKKYIIFLMTLMLLGACNKNTTVGNKQNLFFVRHARTQFNELGRVQGWSDAPLTEEAVKETKKFAENLKDKNLQIDLIVSSDLKRAQDTAYIISKELGDIEVITSELFREVNYGKFEGLPSVEMSKSVMEYYEYKSLEEFLTETDHFLKEVTDAVSKIDDSNQAEEYFRVQKRMNKGIEQLYLKNNEYENILVIGHGMSISIFAEQYMDNQVSQEIPNLSVSTFVNNGEIIEMVNFGSTEYLEKEGE